jgi:hypothetical protein
MTKSPVMINQRSIENDRRREARRKTPIVIITAVNMTKNPGS